MIDGPREFDLLVAGELNPDILIAGPDVRPRFGQVETVVDAIRLEIGSSSAIAACGAARLGLRTAFLGVVGDDLFGRFMLDALVERRVDVSACRLDPGCPTGASAILTDGHDRAILTAIGTIASLRADDVTDDLLRRARHLHVGSAFLQPALLAGLADLFARAAALGVTTSVDGNWDPTERWDGGFLAALPWADVVLPNEAEALRLTGASTPQDAAEELVRRGSVDRRSPRPITVAVKLGAAGALAVRGGAPPEIAQAEARQVEVVDTTGAGDSFDAGFLSGFLAGWPLGRTLDLAVACGALSVRGIGGTSAQPTLAEALRA